MNLLTLLKSKILTLLKSKILTLLKSKKIIFIPHIWVISTITSFLILIYVVWPWPEWKFLYGWWQWFAWLSSLDKFALFEFKYRFIGSLFVIPIIYSTIVFQWRGGLIVSLLALSSVLPLVMIFSLTSRLTNISLLLLPATAASAISIGLQLHRRDRKILAEREKERQTYLSKILETQEQERKRLAQELHDGAIQTLLAVASFAEALESTDEDDIIEMKRKTVWIKDVIRDTAKELRTMSLDLSPTFLEDLGLVPSLKWLVNRANEEYDINIQLVLCDIEHKLAPSVEINVFRVVQEALNNIKRHSKAREAFIILEDGAKSLKITIRDDGQGFVPPKRLAKLATENKLGLIGMQERIKSLGGTFVIKSKPTEGFLLSFEIPT